MPLYNPSSGGSSVRVPSYNHRWKLDEASGTSAADAIGSDNLTYVSASLRASQVPATAAPSAQFAGTVSLALSAAGAPASLNSFGFVLAAWVRPPNGGGATLLAFGDGTVSGGGELLGTGNDLSFVQYGVGAIATGPACIPRASGTTAWFRVAAYFPAGAGTAAAYLNGQRVLSGACTLTGAAGATNRLSVAAATSSGVGGTFANMGAAEVKTALAASLAAADLVALGDYLNQVGQI